MESLAAGALLIGGVAVAVSALTLYSGFGLGTLLMPMFALLLPLEVAVAATAVVHALNNLFKLGLLWRLAAPRVLVRFGLPAVAAAWLGALLLAELSGGAAWLVWRVAGVEGVVTPLGAVMGSLILLFSVFELVPALDSLRPQARWLPLGGALSGFFGGLSGHQGALRAAFLRPLGLAPAAFAATQAVLACMVDASRLLVYALEFSSGRMAGVETRQQWVLVAVGSLCAFAGSYFGMRLLPKITLGLLRVVTGTLLLIVGGGLASGLL